MAQLIFSKIISHWYVKKIVVAILATEVLISPPEVPSKGTFITWIRIKRQIQTNSKSGDNTIRGKILNQTEQKQPGIIKQPNRKET